jgi:hypothetical protein
VQFFFAILYKHHCECAGNREKVFVEILEECDEVVLQEETFPTLAVSIHTNYCAAGSKDMNLKLRIT